MKLIINKVALRNFKAFRFQVFNIGSKNLTVLDGPNGFGKTSFFDALELLLTGDISRYRNLEATMDKRSVAFGSPIVYEDADDGAEISISAEIETSSDIVFLRRSVRKNDLDKDRGLGFSKFKLYEASSLSDQGALVKDEQSYLRDLLGDEYQRNYKLFHYVEQEDNTAVLKSKAVTKQQKIDHLFDVGDYRQRLERIEAVKSQLAVLKNPAQKAALEKLKDELFKLRQSVSGEPLDISAVNYERLVEVTQQPWDLADISATSSVISSWISSEGILSKISDFRRNAQDFLNLRYNKRLEKTLSPKKEAVQNLLLFGNRLSRIEKYQEDIENYDFCVEFLDAYAQGMSVYLSKFSAIEQDIFERLGFSIEFSLLQQRLKELGLLVANSDRLAVALNGLVSARENFLKSYLSDHMDHSKLGDALCPACGYEWESRDHLLAQFDSQKTALVALLESNGLALKIAVESFEKDVLDSLRSTASMFVSAEEDFVDYKQAICDLTVEQIAYLSKISIHYAEHGIELKDYYYRGFKLDEELKVDDLLQAVASLFRPVNYEVVSEEFEELFSQVFSSNDSALMLVSLESIERKRKYLSRVYQREVYEEIKDKERAISAADEIIRKATYLEKALTKLRDIYSENLNAYVMSTAKGIEILFHIYSGRLLQNFQNGLGIFIETDGKALHFKEHPLKRYDVIFSMSSGQLASLVLSFALALNKRYAKNTILLIDDPVQTLDDINIAGFIDILRNEFSDRQIILSTHEDEMSAYMQYKFNKFGLDSAGIDLKTMLNVSF